jgi:hypothetical protein
MKPGKLTKNNALAETGEHWIESTFNFFHEISPLEEASKFLRRPDVPPNSILQSALRCPVPAVTNDSHPLALLCDK